MKTVLLIIAVLYAIPATVFAIDTSISATHTLEFTAKQLSAIRSVDYQYNREINNYKDNYFSKFSADCYLEFDQENKVSRFQVQSLNGKEVYNGIEYFFLDKQAKTYTRLENPSQQSFNNFSFFYNSLASLKNTLNRIIGDDSIPRSQRDTLIKNKTFKIVRLSMHNKALSYLDGLSHFTIDITIFYDLIIDPVSFLPYQILEHNSVDHDQYFTRTTYSAIRSAPLEPKPLSWLFATYQQDYRPKEKNSFIPLVKVGTDLKEWVLPEYTQSKTSVVKSSAFTHKILIMDFWIKNCGYCMESFAHLKTLQEEFGKEEVQIITVNAGDPVKEIAFFYKREKPAYKMLYNGLSLANSLGVQGFPTVIITDKTGKIIYAGNFNQQKIESIVKDNL